MHDEPPDDRSPSSRTEPRALTEAELSRIAREAVHQPADARLDRQLVRMGLMDDTAGPQAPARPVAVDPELDRLRAELQRMRTLLALLVGIIAVLAIIVIALVVR